MRTLKPDEIEIRVGTVGQRKSGGGYATLLLYKDARTDMQILDEVYGTNNWQKDYKEIKGNLYCGIGVWDEEKNNGFGNGIAELKAMLRKPKVKHLMR